MTSLCRDFAFAGKGKTGHMEVVSFSSSYGYTTVSVDVVVVLHTDVLVSVSLLSRPSLIHAMGHGHGFTT